MGFRAPARLKRRAVANMWLLRTPNTCRFDAVTAHNSQSDRDSETKTGIEEKKGFSGNLKVLGSDPSSCVFRQLMDLPVIDW